MIKGASIALICLALGGFLGHRATIFHFETISKSFFEGQNSVKK
jgi:hypothetical protein